MATSRFSLPLPSRLRWASVVACAALGLILAGCAGQPTITKLVDGRLIETRSISPRAYEHASRAMVYEEEDRFAEAVAEYKTALQYDTQSAELHARMAEAYLQLDDVSNAQAAVDRSLAIEVTVDGVVAASHLALQRGSAKDAAAVLLRAMPLINFANEAEAAERIYLERADAQMMALLPAEAMATLETLLSGLPTSQMGLYRQISIAWAVGNLPLARRYLERLIEIEPEHLEARLLLARLFTVLRKRDDARAAYVEALSRSEGDLSVAAMYATFLESEGLHDETVGLVEQMQTSEIDASTLGSRMELERIAGRLPRALQMADEVLATHPNQESAGRVLLAKGSVLESSQRPVEAAQIFQLISAESPSFAEGRLRATAILRDQGKASEAKALLATIPDDDLDEPMKDEIVVARALVAASTGNLAEGRRLLEPSGEKKPVTSRIALARAVLEDKYGDWKQALALSESVLVKDLASAEALNFWAFVAAEKKHMLPTARARAEAALAFDPGSAAIMDTLGWTYLQMDKPQSAQIFLEGAAAIQPDDPEIMGHVAALYVRLGKAEVALAKVKRALELSKDPALSLKLQTLQKSIGAVKGPAN